MRVALPGGKAVGTPIDMLQIPKYFPYVNKHLKFNSFKERN